MRFSFGSPYSDQIVPSKSSILFPLMYKFFSFWSSSVPAMLEILLWDKLSSFKFTKEDIPNKPISLFSYKSRYSKLKMYTSDERSWNIFYFKFSFVSFTNSLVSNWSISFNELICFADKSNYVISSRFSYLISLNIWSLDIADLLFETEGAWLGWLMRDW